MKPRVTTSDKTEALNTDVNDIGALRILIASELCFTYAYNVFAHL